MTCWRAWAALVAGAGLTALIFLDPGGPIAPEGERAAAAIIAAALASMIYTGLKFLQWVFGPSARGAGTSSEQDGSQ